MHATARTNATPQRNAPPSPVPLEAVVPPDPTETMADPTPRIERLFAGCEVPLSAASIATLEASVDGGGSPAPRATNDWELLILD